MSDPFIGEVRVFANTYIPGEGWLSCDGSLHPIGAYQALAALLGTVYGGDGRNTFGVPNLNGMAAVGPGVAPGGSVNYQRGRTYGQPDVAITYQTMAAHTHQLQKKTITAPVSIAKTAAPSASSDLGGLSNTSNVSYQSGIKSGWPNSYLDPATLTASGAASPAPHENRQPFLAMYYAIAYLGDWPPYPN